MWRLRGKSFGVMGHRRAGVNLLHISLHLLCRGRNGGEERRTKGEEREMLIPPREQSPRTYLNIGTIGKDQEKEKKTQGNNLGDTRGKGVR